MFKGALNGVKVIDLSRVVSGPHCTMILGDFGADVIKVEKRGDGDIGRHYAPYYEDEATYFMAHNRNKRSVSLNFRHPKSKDILYNLLKDADVLVENFKAGTLEEMGLDPKTLLEMNPRLIITRISGFGQDGPYSNRTCFDAVAQAMSGLMAITGDPDPVGHPTMVGSYVVDFVSGIYGAVGTLAALQARERTGKGQVVDIAMLDTACSLTHSAIINYFLLNQVAQRNGNQDRAAWPANFYPTIDGTLVYIHAGLDPSFARMCKILGKEKLLESPEYSTLAGRTHHIEECDQMITAWTRQHDWQEVIRICEEAALPCAKVNTIEDMVHDEQLIYRKMIRKVQDNRFGEMTINGPVVKMSDTNPDVFCTAPRLGEHNHDVFANILGYSEAEIRQLECDGVI